MIIAPGNYYPESIVRVSHLNALRELSIIGVRLGDPVLLEGFIQPGDHGGGMFVWVSDSKYADDSDLVIKPDALSNDQAGRWHRLIDSKSSGVGYYRCGGFADKNVQSQEILMDHVVTNAFILKADLVECEFDVGELPFEPYTFTLYLNDTIIGTILIEPTGIITKKTVDNQNYNVLRGDVLTISGQTMPDALLARVRFTLSGRSA